MGRVWQFILLHDKLVAIVLAVVMLGTMLFLLQRGEDLERYRALLERGELDACRTALSRELRKKPDWREARELLFELEIKAGNLTEALEHLVMLAKADGAEKGTELFITALLKAGPEEQDKVMISLPRHFDSHWHWPRRFHIQVGLALHNYYDACESIAHLIMHGQETDEEVLSLSSAINQRPDIDWLRIVNLLSAEHVGVREKALFLAWRYSPGSYRGNFSAAALLAWTNLEEISPGNSLLQGYWQWILGTTNGNLSLAWQISGSSPIRQQEVLASFYSFLTVQQQEQIDALAKAAEDNPEVQALAAMLAGDWQGLVEAELHPDFAPFNRESYTTFKLLRLELEAQVGSLRPELVKNLEFTDIEEAFARGQKGSFLSHVLTVMLQGGYKPANPVAFDALRANMFWADFQDGLLPDPYILDKALLRASSPGDIWNLMTMWLNPMNDDYQERYLPAAQGLLNYLADLTNWSRQVKYLRVYLNTPPMPKPDFVLSNDKRPCGGDYVYQMWLAPTGNQLFYWGVEGYWWVDLVNYSSAKLKVMDPNTVMWSPDGGHFIVYPEADPVPQWVRTADQQILDITLTGTGVGWQGGGRFIFTRSEGELSQAWVYDLTKGSESKLGQPMRGWLQLTASGKLAWVERDGSSLRISSDGTEIMINDADGLQVTGWLPGDTGILLNSYMGDKFFIWYPNRERIAIDILNFRAVGWLDANRLIGTYSLEYDDYNNNHTVVVLDIRDMSLVNTGISISKATGGVSGTYAYGFSSGELMVFRIR